MPDIPDEAYAAAKMAIFVNKNVGDGKYLPEFHSDEALAKAAVDAAAPILAEAVAARIEAHRAEWSQARPGDLVPTAWDRHMKIAARVAAGALSTDDDKKRMAAEAIARGDVVVCTTTQPRGTDDGH